MKTYRALVLVTILGVAASAPALAGQSAERDRQAPSRFRGMDTDGDGVITRAEWRGSAQAFRQQDRNGDGVLSGTEVRGIPAQDPPVTDENMGRRDPPIVRIDDMDADRDGVITRAEWRGDAQAFRQRDTNRDGVLSGNEVRAIALDTDGDGVITRAEWRGDAQGFREQDTNHDGVLSGSEVRALQNLPATDEETRRRELSARFNRADRNRDERIAREEWMGNDTTFARMDRNADGFVTREEFIVVAADRANIDRTAPTSGERRPTYAYQSGYDRGIAEGRRDGKSDRSMNGGAGSWDLEGQRELVQADSGYDARVGPRAEYQAGYRAGFRLGYTEGFGPRSTEAVAYRAGYDRGIAEGRRDGKADRSMNGGAGSWDLEGQRELEQADSGYDARVGPRAEYQAGYRAGFRVGYTEGFGPRNPEAPAYKAGYDRGIAEGRQAGKEDRSVNGGRWDLEGQRELEQADSGYDPRVGPRDQYQAGYRAGFRLGYREGFGPR